MRAAALAAAVIAGFLGVMYVRFSGDTVPAPPTPRPYAAGQPTCTVFRPVSQDVSEPDATCGAIRAAFQPSPWPPPAPVPPPTIHPTKQEAFARVVNTEGTCLNIRVLPNTSAASLDCAAEGVFLRDLGQVAEAEGVVWLHVSTPAGIEGWASTQYLER
jgi:hypothetical protein